MFSLLVAVPSHSIGKSAGAIKKAIFFKIDAWALWHRLVKQPFGKEEAWIRICLHVLTKAA